MARVAEALEVGHIELRAASIDRNDVIDDLCERRNATPLALLAERGTAPASGYGASAMRSIDKTSCSDIGVPPAPHAPVATGAGRFS